MGRVSDQDIWNFFLNLFGGNEYAAAGACGNMQAESGFYSNNCENSWNKDHLSDEAETEKAEEVKAVEAPKKKKNIVSKTSTYKKRECITQAFTAYLLQIIFRFICTIAKKLLPLRRKKKDKYE